MINIIFRVDADHGSSFGTGHASRLSKIYNELKKIKNLNFFVLTSKKSSKTLLNKFFDCKIFNLNKYNYKNLQFLKPKDMLICDTPKGLEQSLFNFSKKKKIKIVSFDDIKKNVLKYDLVINSIYFLKKKIPKKKHIFQGYRYLIIDKKFKNLKKKNLNNKKLLICSGGTNKKQMLGKIVKIIKPYIKAFTVYVIIGPGNSNNKEIDIIKTYKNFKIIKNKLDISYYFKISDYCIVSGGLVMFESVASNIKVGVVKTYEHQKYAIKDLNNRGLINYLGDVKNLNKKKILNFIQNNQNNSKKHKKIIDTKGINRIKRLILKLI